MREPDDRSRTHVTVSGACPPRMTDRHSATRYRARLHVSKLLEQLRPIRQRNAALVERLLGTRVRLHLSSLSAGSCAKQNLGLREVLARALAVVTVAPNLPASVLLGSRGELDQH